MKRAWKDWWNRVKKRERGRKKNEQKKITGYCSSHLYIFSSIFFILFHFSHFILGVIVIVHCSCSNCVINGIIVFDASRSICLLMHFICFRSMCCIFEVLSTSSCSSLFQFETNRKMTIINFIRRLLPVFLHHFFSLHFSFSPSILFWFFFTLVVVIYDNWEFFRIRYNRRVREKSFGLEKLMDRTNERKSLPKEYWKGHANRLIGKNKGPKREKLVQWETENTVANITNEME